MALYMVTLLCDGWVAVSPTFLVILWSNLQDCMISSLMTICYNLIRNNYSHTEGGQGGEVHHL